MQELKLTKSKICLILLPAIGCLILPLILSPLATKEAVAPDGKGALEFAIFLLIFIPLFLLIVAGGIFSFVGLLSKSARPSALLWLLASGACMTCYMGGCFAGSEISNKIRDKALEQVVERAKPLIGAIKSYELKNGHPPESLEEMVPEFISKVPLTGVGVSTNYQYERLTNSVSTYGNNTWKIEVPRVACESPFTTFLYLPLQDYTVLPYGHFDKHDGGWAFWSKG